MTENITLDYKKMRKGFIIAPIVIIVGGGVLYVFNRIGFTGQEIGTLMAELTPIVFGIALGWYFFNRLSKERKRVLEHDIK